MSNKVKIGTLTLTEAARWDRTYEVAAWRSVVEVQPGTYDVFAYYYATYAKKHYWQPCLDAPGVCVEDYCPSLFCGNVLPGSTKQNSAVGQPMAPHGIPYELEANIVLDAGWTADKYYFYKE
jgi:hypothetical protein